MILKETSMFKLAALSLILVGGLSPAYAQTACVSPDPGTSVTFGAYDSGVPNRAVNGNCTIDDLFQDAQAWATSKPSSRTPPK